VIDVGGRFVGIEWPEDDEALSANAQNTIDALLSSDPQARPDADGLLGNLFIFCRI